MKKKKYNKTFIFVSIILLLFVFLLVLIAQPESKNHIKLKGNIKAEINNVTIFNNSNIIGARYDNIFCKKEIVSDNPYSDYNYHYEYTCSYNIHYDLDDIAIKDFFEQTSKLEINGDYLSKKIFIQFNDEEFNFSLNKELKYNNLSSIIIPIYISDKNESIAKQIITNKANSMVEISN